MPPRISVREAETVKKLLGIDTENVHITMQPHGHGQAAAWRRFKETK
jgi:hypothetical protein